MQPAETARPKSLGESVPWIATRLPPVHPDGRFGFVLGKPPAASGEAPHYDVYVFARGLLRHQLTRLYFPDEAEANAADPVLAALTPDERTTLVARTEGDELRFDIRMQGESQTVFIAT